MFEVRSCNNFCRAECEFVALIIQHAKRMLRTVLTSLSCLAVTYYFNYLINGTIFGKKVTGHEILMFC